MIKIGPKLISPISHEHKRTSISAICMTNGSMCPPSQTLGMFAGMFNTQQPLTRGELQKEIREIYATLTSLASLDIPIFNARMMYNCEVPGITKRFK